MNTIKIHILQKHVLLMLLQEMEEFAQSSGDAGIVVFTLGSMIQNITREKANIIASGLAQIPQKVSVLSIKLLIEELNV